MNQLKSMEEHLQSIEDMARFAFFYAAEYLKPRLPEKSLFEAIGDHTILLFHGLEFREKDKFDEIGLCRLLKEAADRFSEYPAADFEEAMWEHCKNALRERAAELYGKSRGIGTPASWNCGSLKYDLPAPEEPSLCRFHIYNTVAPNSLFADPEYLKFLNHPRIPAEEKVKTTEDIFTDRIDKQLIGFLKIIIIKGRCESLMEILDYFLDRVKAFKGIGVAYVTTPFELKEEKKEAICKKLLATTSYKEMEMHYAVDAKLLGGMQIRIGDRVVDSSIQTKLNQLQRNLLKLQV